MKDKEEYKVNEINPKDINVYVEISAHTKEIYIWVSATFMDKNMNISYENNELIAIVDKSNEAINYDELKPFLRLPLGIGQSILKSLHKQMPDKLKDKSTEQIKGQLIAKNEHIESIENILYKIIEKK